MEGYKSPVDPFPDLEQALALLRSQDYEVKVENTVSESGPDQDYLDRAYEAYDEGGQLLALALKNAIRWGATKADINHAVEKALKETTPPKTGSKLAEAAAPVVTEPEPAVEANAIRAVGCSGDHADIEPHTCPYAEEIGGSSELCTCCKECEYQCAMDI